jgi:type IX secretion system PorP/SprF family membrane protein
MVNAAAPVMGNGSMSFYSGMRMQWFTIDDASMRTNTAMFLAKLGEGSSNGFLSMGFNFYNDVTGDNAIKTNSFGIPVNFTLQVDRSLQVSIGISPKLTYRTIANSGTWDAQWNGKSFDDGISSGESLIISNGSYFDMQTGIFVKKVFSQKSRLMVGASLDHVAKPNSTSIGSFSDQLNRRYLLHSGLLIHGKSRLYSYQPSLYASFQGGHYNVLGGFECIYHAKEASRSLIFENGIDVSMAFMYRYMDALIFQLAYRTAGLEIGAGYEVNASKLTRATKSFGAGELFIRMNIGNNSHIYDFRAN